LAIHILNMKEGHFLKKKNPSCDHRDPYHDQEGQAFPSQLFNL
jgi:hypothetical protein